MAWRPRRLRSLGAAAAALAAAAPAPALAAKCGAEGGLIFIGKTSDSSRSVWLSATGAGAFRLEAAQGDRFVDAWSKTRRGLQISASPIVSNGNGGTHKLYDVGDADKPCLLDTQNQKGGFTLPPNLTRPPWLIPGGPDPRPPVTGITPEVPTVRPPVTGITPEVPTVRPPVTGITPEVPTVRPPVTGITPEVPTVRPPVTGITPEVPTIRPPVTGITPEVPTIRPPVTGITPEVPTVRPPVTGITPEVPTVRPPVTGITPEVPTVRPPVTGITPEVPTVRPPVTGITPEVPTVRPPVTGITPEVPTVRPPVTGITPEVPTVRPPVTGITPEVPTIRPPVTGITPEVPTIRPPVTGITPEVPTVRPPVTGITPEIPRRRLAPPSAVAVEPGQSQRAAAAFAEAECPPLDARRPLPTVDRPDCPMAREAPLTPGRDLPAPSRWNFWALAASTSSSDNRSGLDSDGEASALSIGLDRRLSGTLVVGATISWQRSRNDSFGRDLRFRSDVVSLGSYAAIRLSPRWVGDASLSYGEVDNRTQLSVLSGGYATRQVSAEAGLHGDLPYRAATIRPNLSLLYSRLRTGAHQLSGLVTGQPLTVELDGEATEFGLASATVELSRTFTGRRTALIPYVELGAEYEYLRPRGGEILNGALKFEATSPWTFTARGGLRALLTRDVALDAGAGYLSLGGSGLDIWEGQVRLSYAF